MKTDIVLMIMLFIGTALFSYGAFVVPSVALKIVFALAGLLFFAMFGVLAYHSWEARE